MLTAVFIALAVACLGAFVFVAGLAWMVARVLFWILLLPLKLIGVALVLPFVLIKIVLVAVGVTVGVVLLGTALAAALGVAVAFAVPLLPLLLVVWLVWAMMRRGRSAPVVG